MRFAIHGAEKEFTAPLSLDSLHQLADAVYLERGKAVASIHASHATRRRLYELLTLAPRGIDLEHPALLAERDFPDDLITMSPA